MTDVYVEQLVSVQKNAKDYVIFVGTCVLTTVISFALIVFAFVSGLPILSLVAAALIYGATKILSNVGVEYEYIFTNGDLDVDKITGKSNRKRLITIDCAELIKVKKVGRGYKQKDDCDMLLSYCNPADEYVYSFTFRHKSAGKVRVILSANEKLLAAVKTSVPRHMQSSVFEV